MNEIYFIPKLMHKIDSIARALHSRKIAKVKVRLGALSPISAAHFREDFYRASRRTVAEGARLDIEIMQDASDPHAHEIILDKLEIGD
jgi:Zn finger protein HypA/HybF involved in hydrogenase expression